jgi:hypothetical protein
VCAHILVRPAVPDALYYRQQAERFARVANQCSIAELVPYYREMAFDYLARAEAKSENPWRRGSRPAQARRAEVAAVPAAEMGEVLPRA